MSAESCFWLLDGWVEKAANSCPKRNVQAHKRLSDARKFCYYQKWVTYRVCIGWYYPYPQPFPSGAQHLLLTCQESRMRSLAQEDTVCPRDRGIPSTSTAVIWSSTSPFLMEMKHQDRRSTSLVVTPWTTLGMTSKKHGQSIVYPLYLPLFSIQPVCLCNSS